MGQKQRLGGKSFAPLAPNNANLMQFFGALLLAPALHGSLIPSRHLKPEPDIQVLLPPSLTCSAPGSQMRKISSNVLKVAFFLLFNKLSHLFLRGLLRS